MLCYTTLNRACIEVTRRRLPRVLVIIVLFMANLQSRKMKIKFNAIPYQYIAESYQLSRSNLTRHDGVRTAQEIAVRRTTRQNTTCKIVKGPIEGRKGARNLLERSQGVCRDVHMTANLGRSLASGLINTSSVRPAVPRLLRAGSTRSLSIRIPVPSFFFLSLSIRPALQSVVKQASRTDSV